MSGRLSLTQAFVFLLRRDLLLALRNRAEYAMPLLFFVLVITLFPLALGAVPELLARIAPGIIWVAALLAAMLSLDSIFRSDFDDGSLEQILLSAHPVAVLVLAKVSAHWLVTGLPYRATITDCGAVTGGNAGHAERGSTDTALDYFDRHPNLESDRGNRCCAYGWIAKRWYNPVAFGIAVVCTGVDFRRQRNRKCGHGI